MKTSFTSVIQPMKTHLVAECLALHPSILAKKSEKNVKKHKFLVSTMSLPLCLHTKNLNVREPMKYYLYSAPGGSH